MKSEELCGLCECVHTDIIGIFGTVGVQLGVAGLLIKHYHLEMQVDDEQLKQICRNCWSITKDFNELYCRVQQRNVLIDSKTEPNDDRMETEVTQHKVELQDDSMIMLEETYADSQSDHADMDGHVDDSGGEVSETNAKRTKRNEPVFVAVNRRERPLKASKSAVPKQEATPGKLSKDAAPIGDDEANSKTQQRLDEDSLIREYFAMACELCGTEFQTLIDARVHYRTKHQKTGYLACCNKRFFYRGGLIDHISVHLNPEAFKCSTCHKSFGNKFALADHMELKHMSQDDKQFECDKCDRKFTKRYRLKQHIAVSHREVTTEKQRLICDTCEKSFGNKAAILSHIRSYHLYNTTKICDICAKTFHCEKTFQSHCQTHIDQPRMQCSICGKWLKSKDSLRSHVRRHNDTEHICTYCNKRTPNRQALANHILYVHGEKTHKCTMCDKAFKVALGLKEHMASHTGLSLYTCPYCPRTFNSNGNMHKHRKNVHTDEWRRDREQRLRKLTVPYE